MAETNRTERPSKEADNLTEWLPTIAAAVREIDHGSIELVICSGRIVEVRDNRKYREPLKILGRADQR